MKAFLVSRFSFLVALTVALASAQPPPTMVPAVRGIHEMVGAANNFEVEAGYRILTQGGNAVDAGVATVLAASVTELSRFGLGGEMPALIKMSGKPVVAISGIGVAPAKATVDFYQRRSPEPWEDSAHMPPVPMQGILLRYYPRRVRRPDSGARKIRHQNLRRSGGAGHRGCRTGFSDAGRVCDCCAATSALLPYGRIR